MNNALATPETPTTATPRLDADQIAHFRREGYLVYPDPVLPADEFAALRAHFDRRLAELPPGTRPEAMDVPHFTDPELFRWVLSDPVLDLVEPLLGPDIALFSTHFICKPKGDGRRVPWHEDSAYWRSQVTPMEIVTVWLAVDPSTEENGCMFVIPRTHETGRKGFSDYDPVDTARNVFPTEITPAQRNAALAKPCVLAANHASLHDARLMHGSEPNHSDKRRCGYTMRFMSTRTKFDSERQGQWHHIYLARGRDHAGNVYGDPTQSYPEKIARRVQDNKKGH